MLGIPGGYSFLTLAVRTSLNLSFTSFFTEPLCFSFSNFCLKKMVFFGQKNKEDHCVWCRMHFLQIDSIYHFGWWIMMDTPPKSLACLAFNNPEIIMGPTQFLDFGSRKKLLAIPRPLITRNCWMGGPGTSASPTFSSSSWPSCLQDHLSFLNRRSRDPEVWDPTGFRCGTRMEKHGREWRLLTAPWFGRFWGST